MTGAVEEGTWPGGVPYLRVGAGRPLVLLPGLTEHHRPPQGLDRHAALAQARSLAHGHQVWWVNRPADLAPGTTMAQIGDTTAALLRERVGSPLDLVGVSTGGSLALQIAADHPSLVRRLVVVSAAYRLGDAGRAAQRRSAEALRAGDRRTSGAATMAMLGAGPITHRMGAALGRVVGFGEPGGGLVRLIEAEDAFDLHDRLCEISAPTLLVAGERDAFYGADLFRETARLIPDARLVLYPGRGHLGGYGRRLTDGIAAFLDR